MNGSPLTVAGAASHMQWENELSVNTVSLAQIGTEGRVNVCSRGPMPSPDRIDMGKESAISHCLTPILSDSVKNKGN